MKDKENKKMISLKRKTVYLIVGLLAVTVIVFSLGFLFQNRMLSRIVGESKAEQQQAISQTSEATMRAVMGEMLVNSTALQAKIADNDFAEIVNDTYMLQAVAEEMLSRNGLSSLPVGLPDPAMDGKYSAMALAEEGVDYTQSAYLGRAAHLSDFMIAMCENSDKIAAVYIGFADGTHLAVDSNTLNKYDENGEPIPFPVRERPWYTGAMQAGKIYFTGIEQDAFSGLPYITCSVPVTVRGRVIGVAGVDIVLENMRDFITASDRESSFAFIINDAGQVIMAPENNNLFDVTIAAEAQDLRNANHKTLGLLVAEALKQQTDLNTLTIDGKRYYAAGTPMPTVGWAVITIVNKAATEQPEHDMINAFNRINNAATEKYREGNAHSMRIGIFAGIVLLLTSIVVSLFSAEKITKPLEAITETIIDSGKTGELFEMKDTYRTGDEIEVLAESFADLSQKTKQYIEDITAITKEKERVSTELNMANQIQTSMLPHIFPAFPNRSEFDIYASMDPAREVGGDFYDYYLIDDDHLAITVADVSGKGVPGALFMMVSKAILKNNAMVGKPVGEILSQTNEMICANNKQEMFVTVWMGILEISTGKITAANAGHEYPVLTSNGVYELIKDQHSFVVGGMSGAKYKEYELQMRPGDRLFLYTDGLPEAMDAEGKMFGTDRMLTVLNSDPDAEPHQVLDNIRTAVDGFVSEAEQFDDLTMLCIEYKGPSGENGPVNG